MYASDRACTSKSRHGPSVRIIVDGIRAADNGVPPVSTMRHADLGWRSP